MKRKLWKFAPLLCGAGVLLPGAIARADAPDAQLQKMRVDVLAAGQKGAASLPMLAQAMKNPNALVRCAAARTALTDAPSAIISPAGKELATTTSYFDFVTATLNLDCRVAHLGYNREKLKALKAQYGVQVTIADPGFLGSVLITGEHGKITADEMVREFGIELLDDYLVRALAHQHEACNQEKAESTPGKT